MSKLPVLNYHGIDMKENEYAWLEEEKPYVLSLETFEKQLDYILVNKFETLTLGGLQNWLDGRQVPARPLMLTFDDGHLSHFEHVMPALKKRNLKAVFFVPVAHVGEKGHMNWDQLKEMVKAGFEIGSHGFRHIPLSNLTHHELWKEVQKSKKILESNLGVEIKSFSVPRGFYQLRIREVTMELGFRFVFTSRFDVNELAHDPWRLNRIAVKKNLSFTDFSRFIDGNLGLKRVIERVKEGLRRFVHPSFYDWLAAVKRTMTHG